MNEKEIVYGYFLNYLVFIPVERAREMARVYEALQNAKTWGEFRTMLPVATYEKYLQKSDHYKSRYISNLKDLTPYYIPDDTRFRAKDVFKMGDPDAMPGHPEIEMSIWIPPEIQEKYGGLTAYYASDGNVPGGNILELVHEKEDEIVAALEVAGYHCQDDQELIDRAVGVGFEPGWYDEDDADDEND